jgi:TM2 domain-containing membrane protein YozV
MNIAMKASLFNALLFPGWGEIYLKKYKRGILIIIATAAGILSVLWSIIQTTIKILRFAPFKKGTVTVSAVFQLAIDSIKAMDLSYLLLIIFSMIFLWIISIVDAYLLGKEEMTRVTTVSDQESAYPEG